MTADNESGDTPESHSVWTKNYSKLKWKVKWTSCTERWNGNLNIFTWKSDVFQASVFLSARHELHWLATVKLLFLPVYSVQKSHDFIIIRSFKTRTGKLSISEGSPTLQTCFVWTDLAELLWSMWVSALNRHWPSVVWLVWVAEWRMRRQEDAHHMEGTPAVRPPSGVLL